MIRPAAAAPKRRATVTWADQSGPHAVAGQRPSVAPKRYATAAPSSVAEGGALTRRSAGALPHARPSAYPPHVVPAEDDAAAEDAWGLRTGRDAARARVPLGQAVA